MIRTVPSFAGRSLAACAVLAVLAGRLPAAERPSDPQTRPTPAANGAQQAAGAKGPADASKEAIEFPTKTVIAGQSAPSTPATSNPKVEPGKVRWHANFAAACTAAQNSGKPVLLFQMMGKLDEQFC
jgi:hypothetical protein